MAAVGYKAPQLMTAFKTSQANSVHTNNKWFGIVNDDLYYEMTLPAVGVAGGWGDGTTDGVAKKTSVGTNNKVHECGYDRVNDTLTIFTRDGAVRWQTTGYTSGSDSFGSTTTTRLDGVGNDFDNSGFDSGKACLIVDTLGSGLLFSLGAAADSSPLGDGLLIAYDPLSDTAAQIESGFDRSAATNLDAFLFNDGSDDYVGVLYNDGTNWKIAYHIEEATVANYATGWDIETAGIPVSITTPLGPDTMDDHACARAYSGSMYAVVKGGVGANGYLITTTGGIDTATNSTTFVITEFCNHLSRPVIVINESTEEMDIYYEDKTSGSVISKKNQPLSGFSFTPTDQGTIVIDDDLGSNFLNPTPPAHNVTAAMGTYNIFADENTGTNETWYHREALPAAPIEASSAFSAAISSVSANNAIFGASSGFSVSNGVTEAGQADYQAASIISQSMGLLSSAGSLFEALSGFDVNNQISAIKVADFVVQNAFSFNSSMQSSKSFVMGAAATISFDSSVVSVSGANIDAASSLALTHAISSQSAISIEGVSSYATSCALASQIIADLTAQSSFDIVAGMISQANAVLLAQSQLSTGNSFSVTIGQVIEAFGTLSITSSIDALGVVTTDIDFAPLKDGRNVTVLAQERLVTVLMQTRNVIVIN